MDKLGRINLPRLNHGNLENLSRPITGKEITSKIFELQSRSRKFHCWILLYIQRTNTNPSQTHPQNRRCENTFQIIFTRPALPQYPIRLILISATQADNQKTWLQRIMKKDIQEDSANISVCYWINYFDCCGSYPPKSHNLFSINDYFWYYFFHHGTWNMDHGSWNSPL